MAILKGFPASNTISPSVRVTEKDLSFLVNETQQAQRTGLIGFASKGPINTPTQVTSIADFNMKFGYPHPSEDNPCWLAYAAMMALQVTNELYIVRCAETNNISPYYAETASVEVPSKGDPVEIVGANAITTSTTTTKNMYFRWRLNGTLSSKTLVLLAGTYAAITDVKDALNAQLDQDIDGIYFDVSADKLVLKTTWSYGPSSSVEIVSISNPLFGGTVVGENIFGLAKNATQATKTGTATMYGTGATAGNYIFGVSETDLRLAVVVQGTGNVNFDGKTQTIDLSSFAGSTKTIAQIVTAINGLKTSYPAVYGGWTASASTNSLKFTADGYGRDSKFAVKAASSTMLTIFGFDTTVAVGTSPSGDTTGVTANFAIVTGAEAAATDYSFTVEGDTPGSECNNIFVVCKNDSSGGTFNLNVYSRNPLTKAITQVESWGNLTKDTTSVYYVETYVSAVSNYINIVDNTSISSPPADSPTSGTSVLFLSGGTDGVPPITEPELRDLLLIGSPFSMSGLYSFSEPEQTDIDTIAVPGGTSTAVIEALIDLCANYRQDCFAVIDPPSGMDPTEVIQWQNGQSNLNSVRFNTDFAALYWPWIIYRDTYNGLDVTIPPSCGVITAYARSDNLSFPWFAPAGLTRGIIPGVIGLAMNPTLAEKDAMYGNGNAINPIVKYVGNDNYMLWGQKTLQRLPSALDRVNVRRMLFYIEKQIRAQARGLLFEPHTAELRTKFINIASSILTTVKVNSGVYDYYIKCDEELNTPNVIDRNELRAQIGLQPTRSTEFIFVEFSLHRTGSFTESTAVVR